MSVVRTTKGTLAREWWTPPTQSEEGVPLTEEQAQAIADEKNAKAEAIGITARYEVTEK